MFRSRRTGRPRPAHPGWPAAPACGGPACGSAGGTARARPPGRSPAQLGRQLGDRQRAVLPGQGRAAGPVRHTAARRAKRATSAWARHASSSARNAGSSGGRRRGTRAAVSRRAAATARSSRSPCPAGRRGTPGPAAAACRRRGRQQVLQRLDHVQQRSLGVAAPDHGQARAGQVEQLGPGSRSSGARAASASRMWCGRVSEAAAGRRAAAAPAARPRPRRNPRPGRPAGRSPPGSHAAVAACRWRCSWRAEQRRVAAALLAGVVGGGRAVDALPQRAAAAMRAAAQAVRRQHRVHVAALEAAMPWPSPQTSAASVSARYSTMRSAPSAASARRSRRWSPAAGPAAGRPFQLQQVRLERWPGHIAAGRGGRPVQHHGAAILRAAALARGANSGRSAIASMSAISTPSSVRSRRARRAARRNRAAIAAEGRFRCSGRRIPQVRLGQHAARCGSRAGRRCSGTDRDRHRPASAGRSALQRVQRDAELVEQRPIRLPSMRTAVCRRTNSPHGARRARLPTAAIAPSGAGASSTGIAGGGGEVGPHPRLVVGQRPEAMSCWSAGASARNSRSRVGTRAATASGRRSARDPRSCRRTPGRRRSAPRRRTGSGRSGDGAAAGPAACSRERYSRSTDAVWPERKSGPARVPPPSRARMSPTAAPGCGRRPAGLRSSRPITPLSHPSLARLRRA